MATISGVDQPGRVDARPWISSNGAYYLFARDSAAPTKMRAMKAADPTGVWSALDTANEPATGDFGIVASATFPDGDEFPTVFMQTTGGSNRICIARFLAGASASADTWAIMDGGSSRQVIIASPTTGGEVGCDIAVRSDGSYVVVASDSLVSTHRKVSVWVSSDKGATWTALGNIYSPSTGEQRNPRCVLGDNDNVHIMWTDFDGTNANIWQRTLKKDNTFGTASDTTVNGNAVYCLGTPNSVVHGSSLISIFPYNDAGGTLKEIHFTSINDPVTFATSQIATGIAFNGGYPAVNIIADGRIARASYVKSADQDAYINNDGSTNTWSGETAISVGTYTYAGSSVYDRAGGPVLGTILYAGGYGYGEPTVGGSYTTLSSTTMCDLPSFHGPIYDAATYAFMVDTSFTRGILMKTTSMHPADNNWAKVGDELMIWQNTRHKQGIDPNGTTIDGGTRALDVHESGGVIYALLQNESGLLSLHGWNVAGATWSPRLERVADPVTDGITNYGAVSNGSCGYRRTSGGHAVAGACYHDNGSPTHYRIRIFRKPSGGAWTNQGAGDDGVANTDYHNFRICGPDSSDRITWVYTDNTNSAIKTKSIDSTGTISGSTLIYQGTGPVPPQRVGRPQMVGNTIYCPFVGDDGILRVASWTSGASPTITVTQNVSSTAVYRYNQGLPPSPSEMVDIAILNSVPIAGYIRNSDNDIGININPTLGKADQVYLSGINATRLNMGPVNGNLGILYLDTNPTFFAASPALGASSGLGTVSGSGKSLNLTTGSSQGRATVAGIGAPKATGTGSSTGRATVLGFPIGTVPLKAIGSKIIIALGINL